MHVANGWLLLITMPVGVTRALGLFMNDKLLQRPRDWAKAHSKLFAKSITCPWCTSLQIALVTCALLAWSATRPVMAWGLVAGTVSFAATLLDRVCDRVTLLMDNADTEPPAEVAEAFKAGS